MANNNIALKTNRLVADHAARQVAKVHNLYIAKKLKSWADIESNLGIQLDSAFTVLPFNWSSVQTWMQAWKASAQNRAEAANKIALVQAATKPKLQVAKSTETFNKVTLFPEQQAVYETIRDNFWVNKSSRFHINDGETGSGKTYLAAALIHYCIQNKLWLSDTSPLKFDLPYRILVLTPKNVIESYKRVLESFGMGTYIGHTIMVTSYSQMTASFGSLFYKEVFNPWAEDPEESRLEINPAFTPYFVITDEFHRLNHPSSKQTKFAMALANLPVPPFILAMSATPWVTVNHSRFAVVASRRQYFGMKVTEANFNLFAQNITKTPHKPNIEAAKRLRNQLADTIVSFPRVKWKSKAINQVLIVDFETQKDKEAADAAYEVFLERKRKAGENTKFGRFEAFIAMGQYRKAVEPFRVPAMVERTLADLNNNKAVVIGTAFRKTVADAVYRLNQHGIPREKISIIWGGKREWNKSLLLTEEEQEALLQRAIKGEMLDPFEVRQLRETLDYRTERILANESEAEQVNRLNIQKELGLLGTQSAAARQEEIDRFQSGESLVCIFTLAAGGVGLSLDQCTPDLRPRVGYFTPVYSGPEFKQALGRTIRRATVSDVYQYMCYMKGTVESDHVAPLIDRKLKCIAAITGNIFNVIDLDTANKIEHKYRTAEEAAQDADDIDSQFQSYQDPTDNESDD